MHARPAKAASVMAAAWRAPGGVRLGARAAHVRVAEFGPQQRILPSVDAVVWNAGSATVLGALAHGAPLVAAPGHRPVAGNVGVQASSGPPTGEDVRVAVLTDPSIRASQRPPKLIHRG
jgi:hypothetical protein